MKSIYRVGKRFFCCILFIICVFNLHSVRAANAVEDPKSTEIFFSEKLVPLGKQLPGTKVFQKSFKISPDNEHLAFVSKKGNKYFVTIDGRVGTEWDQIIEPTPIFSPVGNRVAYISSLWKNAYAVVDEKAGPEFNHIWDVMFSPDGKHFAYLSATIEKKIKIPYLVINHRKGINTLGINQVKFSPDSKHLAYIAYLFDFKWHVIRDGKQGPGYDMIEALVFSPDSKHLSYIATDKKDQFVVLDEKKLEPSGIQIGMTTFSPDSSRFAYAVFNIKDQKWEIIVDGGKKASVVLPLIFNFSPDSSKWAFQGGDSPTSLSMFINGVQGEEYGRCSAPFFSPDSSHLAYFVEDGDKWYMIVDGKAHERFKEVFPPSFSQDSRHMAYRAKADDQKMQVILDGKGSKIYENVGTPIFSNNGFHLAYTVKDGDDWFMNLDGKLGNHYDGLGLMAFSPGDEHFVFTALKDGKWRIVVDGIEGKAIFDKTIPESRIVFTSPDNFHLLASIVNGKIFEFYRLEAKITK